MITKNGILFLCIRDNRAYFCCFLFQFITQLKFFVLYKTTLGIHKTRIPILINRRFFNLLLNCIQTDIHTNNSYRHIININRYYIRNHCNIDILIKIRIHPCWFFIFYRNIIPSHMFQIIFVICTKIRRLYTFKAIICRISCQKNPGCRQRKIRIISCIRCQCSVCILCKMQHRIFNLFCIIFYIFRTGLK